MDNTKKEVDYICNDKIQKCEEKLLQEITLRDEKFKNIRVENQEYFKNIDKNIQNLNKEVNLVKNMNKDTNKKIESIENKSNENLI